MKNIRRENYTRTLRTETEEEVSASSADRPSRSRSRKIRRGEEERRREEISCSHLIGDRHHFSVADSIGASTTYDGLTTRTARENEAAAIKGNQGTNHGINQSTGRRGRIKTSGCSRNPVSGGSQLSGEESKRVPKYRIRNISGAISFLDDRGRSSEIKSDDRNDSIHQAVYYYIYCIYGICWIYHNYRASLVEVIAFIIFSYKWGKQAFTCLPGEPEDINDLSCTLESAFEQDDLRGVHKAPRILISNEPSDINLKTKAAMFFRWTNYLPSQQDLLHPPDDSIVNHSISNAEIFENSKIS